MYFSSDELRWRNRIIALAEAHPDEVTILEHPDQNDGCVYAKLPVEYLKIQPKRNVNLSDEQRIAASERLKSLRKPRLEN